MRQLTNFDITVRETDFVLHLEADNGETLEFETSAEQLDNLLGRLDDVLTDDDGEEEDEEVYQKPLG
jgi:hypothetical protein